MPGGSPTVSLQPPERVTPPLNEVPTCERHWRGISSPSGRRGRFHLNLAILRQSATFKYPENEHFLMPTSVPIPEDAIETDEGWYMLVHHLHTSAENRMHERRE